jgi:predicted DNA-binding protein
MAKSSSEEVATHVLIPTPTAERLRDLSRKTRVTQSEYLREAVSDLLKKYGVEAIAARGSPEEARSNG